MSENYLYHWLFHYNSYMNVWFAFHREDQDAYWNGTESKYAIIKSSKIPTLLEIIRQTDGDKTKLAEIDENRST